MVSKPGKELRHRLGRPTKAVLFRTPLTWRHAVYFAEPSGVLDGALTDEPADGPLESAQAARR